MKKFFKKDILLLLLFSAGLAFPQTVFGITGDVNTDNLIDIVDALLIAQYYVGLNPANFDIGAADTDCSGSADIVDALLVSQYYVGLLNGFAVCDTGGLSLLSDTNRDGLVNQEDMENHTNWAWRGDGAFLIANVDDDDRNGTTDASDQVVNGADDEMDLARIIVRVGSDALANATGISVSLSAGAGKTHLFERRGTSWAIVNNTLSRLSPEIELGIEATHFADIDWDGFVFLKADLVNGQTVIDSKTITMRVAPWLMLPNSAKTEFVYILGTSVSTNMQAGINNILRQKGLPDCQASTPGGQDQWYQDTMEVGFTQLPGFPPMHVASSAYSFTGNRIYTCISS